MNYAYNSNLQITPHFNVNEFRCKCGKTHDTKLSPEFVQMLEALYQKMGCSKAVISSGYRCAYWDRAVGGYGSGPHVEGVAADICFYNKAGKVISSKLVSCVAQDMGFKGIANITWNYDYIHLDMKGRIYKGNEVYGYNTVTSDFYAYYGITRAQVQAIIGNSTSTVTTPTTTTTPVNNKDKSTNNFVYSNKFDSQIKELQQIFVSKGYSLAVDGYAGPKTYDVCRKFTIEKGDRGPLTRWVQSRLNSKGYNCGLVDGIAGVGTMSAIKAFQKANKLGQGYLGGTDWYYLIK